MFFFLSFLLRVLIFLGVTYTIECCRQKSYAADEAKRLVYFTSCSSTLKKRKIIKQNKMQHNVAFKERTNNKEIINYLRCN